MADICVFGEVLFDCFADGAEVLGGAPFNVAWNLQALGVDTRFVSRVGDDAAGARVREAMQRWGLDTGGLQIDRRRPTGRVQVDIRDGEPRYDIVQDSAWDAIEPLAQPSASLFYHGSLAARSPRSAAALAALRRDHTGTVFIDANLRPPWWTPQGLHSLMTGADWVKLNREELGQLDGGGDAGRDFLERYALAGLLVTRGSEGAEVFTARGEHRDVSPGPCTEVVDTVGAGDAFASVMLLGLLRAWEIQRALDRAQQFAAAVVGRRGATVADPAFYQSFREAWGLA